MKGLEEGFKRSIDVVYLDWSWFCVQDIGIVDFVKDFFQCIQNGQRSLEYFIKGYLGLYLGFRDIVQGVNY